jgi:hypothetical protein
MKTKDNFNLTRTLQEKYLADMDMSGSLYIEYENNNKYNSKNKKNE